MFGSLQGFCLLTHIHTYECTQRYEYINISSCPLEAILFCQKGTILPHFSFPFLFLILWHNFKTLALNSLTAALNCTQAVSKPGQVRGGGRGLVCWQYWEMSWGGVGLFFIRKDNHVLANWEVPTRLPTTTTKKSFTSNYKYVLKGDFSVCFCLLAFRVWISSVQWEEQKATGGKACKGICTTI